MESLPTAATGAEKQPRYRWKRFLRFVVLVLIVLVSALVLAGIYELWPREYFSSTQDQIALRLNAYVNEVMASRPAPGIAVGVVKGDTLIFSKGYGLQHLKERGSVSPETVFHTASVSKTLVALAVMQLVEHGQVRLDTRVVRYLPYFRLSDARSSQITIRQLLSHASGMPTDVEGGSWWEADRRNIAPFPSPLPLRCRGAASPEGRRSGGYVKYALFQYADRRSATAEDRLEGSRRCGLGIHVHSRHDHSRHDVFRARWKSHPLLPQLASRECCRRRSGRQPEAIGPRASRAIKLEAGVEFKFGSLSAFLPRPGSR